MFEILTQLCFTFVYLVLQIVFQNSVLLLKYIGIFIPLLMWLSIEYFNIKHFKSDKFTMNQGRLVMLIYTLLFVLSDRHEISVVGVILCFIYAMRIMNLDLYYYDDDDKSITLTTAIKKNITFFVTISLYIFITVMILSNFAGWDELFLH